MGNEEEDIPPFESPLCSFKIKMDVEDDRERSAQAFELFHERTKVLVAELVDNSYSVDNSNAVDGETVFGDDASIYNRE